MGIGNRPKLGGPLTPIYVVGGEEGANISTKTNEVSVPTQQPAVGQIILAATGISERLSGIPVDLPTSSVLVYALADNTAAVAVGGSNVTAPVDGTGNGFILEAGQSVVIMVNNLNLVYVAGTQDDVVTYSAG